MRKYFSCCLLVYTFMLLTTFPTFSEPLRGTFFFASFDREIFAVAIDSLIVGTNSPGNDRYCKIAPLNNNLIFFSTGMGIAYSAASGFNFEASEVAKKVVPLAAERMDMFNISNKWADQMVYNMGYLHARDKSVVKHAVKNSMVKGYFAGAGPDGDLRVYTASVNVTGEAESANFTKEVQRARTKVGMFTFMYNGNRDIVGEFAGDGKTERAREKLTTIRQGWEGKDKVDRMADVAEGITQSVISWGDDPKVGGEVAAITMKRGERWRWHRRPDFCLMH